MAPHDFGHNFDKTGGGAPFNRQSVRLSPRTRAEAVVARRLNPTNHMATSIAERFQTLKADYAAACLEIEAVQPLSEATRTACKIKLLTKLVGRATEAWFDHLKTVERAAAGATRPVPHPADQTADRILTADLLSFVTAEQKNFFSSPATNQVQPDLKQPLAAELERMKTQLQSLTIGKTHENLHESSA